MTPRIVKIYSENNDFQYIEALRRKREKRQRSGDFFVEGVRPINLALDHGWDIGAFVFPREAHLSDWATGILARSSASVHYSVPPALMEKLSAKTDSSELIAVVRMPPDDLSRIPIHPAMRVVVFDRPANPGNLGTLIRSCDSLGVDGMVLTGHATDLYDPEVISSSTGSFFALPVVRKASYKDVQEWVHRIRGGIGRIDVVGTSAKATEPLWQHAVNGAVMVLIGNETWGLSAAYKEMAEIMVQIPGGGSATSLNVACAASIVLYEIERQRQCAQSLAE